MVIGGWGSFWGLPEQILLTLQARTPGPQCTPCFNHRNRNSHLSSIQPFLSTPSGQLLHDLQKGSSLPPPGSPELHLDSSLSSGSLEFGVLPSPMVIFFKDNLKHPPPPSLFEGSDMIDSPAPSLPGAQGDPTNTGCANQVLTYITFVLIFGQLMHFEYVIHSQHLGLKESRRIWGRSLPLLCSAGSQLLPRVASLLCISPGFTLQAVGDIRVPLSPQQQDTSCVIPPHHLSWSLFSSLPPGISTDSHHL